MAAAIGVVLVAWIVSVATRCAIGWLMGRNQRRDPAWRWHPDAQAIAGWVLMGVVVIAAIGVAVGAWVVWALVRR